MVMDEKTNDFNLIISTKKDVLTVNFENIDVFNEDPKTQCLKLTYKALEEDKTNIFKKATDKKLTWVKREEQIDTHEVEKILKAYTAIRAKQIMLATGQRQL